MRFLPLRLPAILFVLVALAGHSYGAPSPNLPANTTTNLSARAEVRQEDVLWDSARKSLEGLQFREAQQKFSEFARQYMNDERYKQAMYFQGVCEMKLGHEKEALNTWYKLLKLDMLNKTKSEAALSSLEQMVQYYGLKGKDTEKKKALNQLLQDFPSSEVTVKLFVREAQARLAESDYSGAAALYRSVDSNLCEEDRANLELAVMMSSGTARNPRQLLDYANKSLEENNVDYAIKLYQAFLKENAASPLAAEARTKLGWCYYLRERFADAEKLWKEVIGRGPAGNEWVGESRWQTIVLMAGPYHKAEAAQKLCLIQAKEFAGKFRGEQALFTRAWLYWVGKQWVEAKAAFEELIRAYPEKALHEPIKAYLNDCEKGLYAGGRKGN